MSEKYEPIRAESLYIRPSEGGEVRYTMKKPDVEKIANFKKVTSDWTLVAKIAAVNEELHNVTDLETKMEFLVLKSKLLEVAALGSVSCAQCSFDEYLDYLN